MPKTSALPLTPAESVHLARKLMRYIRLYNRKPKPIKWRYSDPSQRIDNHSFDSIGTVH
jgi:hypothetical protein